MFIEAMMHTPGMVEPTLSLLVHSKTPEDLLIKGCQLTSLGGGYPQFINHDLLVGNLLAGGALLDGAPAVLKSVGKINNAEVSLGQTLNMKVDPAVFETDGGFKRLADLIRVFVDQKVDHIQINVVSLDTLKAAQEEPDRYKDLVVKVAGYNARFVDLHKELQDSIIAGTEHGL